MSLDCGLVSTCETKDAVLIESSCRGNFAVWIGKGMIVVFNDVNT